MSAVSGPNRRHEASAAGQAHQVLALRLAASPDRTGPVVPSPGVAAAYSITT